MGRSFKGGVVLKDLKYSANSHIEDVPLPDKVVIPLKQHPGAEAKPVVKVGDSVKRGQLIGEGQGPISARVHSSISGRVTSISPHFTFTGERILSVSIESDKKDEGINFVGSKWERLSPEEIREKVKSAGIVGLGGATFPTHIKLTPPKSVDTVILNGCECEPFLTSDFSLMLKRPKEIIEGFKIIIKTLGAKDGIIAIEDNKRKSVDSLKSPVTSHQSPVPIRIVILPTKYPQGSEKELIKAILKREVPSGGLPFDVGVVVQNVATAYAIYEAVVFGKPLIERVVTVSGSAVKSPKNFRVRIGTLFSDIVKNSSIDLDKVDRVIAGGPMMGIAQQNLDIPVSKGVNGLLFLSKDEVYHPQIDSSCIRCGRCNSACPQNLLVSEIGQSAEFSNWERAKELGISDCMECGSCAYVCPAKRPLVQLIKKAKREIVVSRGSVALHGRNK